MEVTRAIFVSLMLNDAFWCDRTYTNSRSSSLSTQPGTLVDLQTRAADTIGDFMADEGRGDSRFAKADTPAALQARPANRIGEEITGSLSPKAGTLVDLQTRAADTIRALSTNTMSLKEGTASRFPKAGTPTASTARSAATLEGLSNGTIEVSPDLDTSLARWSRVVGIMEVSPASVHLVSLETQRGSLFTLYTSGDLSLLGTMPNSSRQASPEKAMRPRSRPTSRLIKFVQQYYMQDVPVPEADATAKGMGSWSWSLEGSRPRKGQTAILTFHSEYPGSAPLVQAGEKALILGVFDYRRSDATYGKDLKQWRSTLPHNSRIIGFSYENEAMGLMKRQWKKPIEYRGIIEPLEGGHDTAYILLLNYPRRWVLAFPHDLHKAVDQPRLVAIQSPEARQFFQPFPEHTIAKIWQGAEEVLEPELGKAFKKGKLVRTELPLDQTGIDDVLVTMACGEGYETFIVPLWALAPLATSKMDYQQIQNLMEAEVVLPQSPRDSNLSSASSLGTSPTPRAQRA